MDPDDFDALETVEQVPDRKERSGFSLMLDACGLTSTDEAMRYLKQSRSSIEKKRGGSLPSTFEDGRALSHLWHEIRIGRVDRERWPGPWAMSSAMLVLSGKKAPEAARRGRPPVVPAGSNMTPMEYKKQLADKAIAELLAGGVHW